MALTNFEKWKTVLPLHITQKMYELLDEVNKMRMDGQTIYPPQQDIFNALSFVSPDDVKVVILGQDPYHEEGQAMGLSFSVPEGIPLPPSLQNIYKELSQDIGIEIPKSGDLSKWEEEGVLLLNTVLTVKRGLANSHKNLGWQEVTTAVIKYLMTSPNPIVFIAWGRQAENLINDIANDNPYHTQNNYGIRSTHPSPLSALKTNTSLEPFIGSRPFSRANRILQENNIVPIKWEVIL